MSYPAISVEGLSKCYRIGARRAGYKTLRETINETVAAPFHRLRGRRSNAAGPTTELWALKNVSFDIQPGQVVGVIGRNGAGKSTLLKILSRITEPTEGYADIRGRVGSLLEVGTGFHPELTGRENVFLNGAILGMRKAEIERKFDDIVDFAELAKFIDTPVKHYSTGMGTRLAFAVACHLLPEILIVDEVLAVGDVEFQRKCTGRMGEVVNQGKTVVIVSHNMATVQALCDTVIWLENGEVKSNGSPDQVVGQYLNSASVNAAEQIITEPDNGHAPQQIRVTRVRLVNSVANTFSVYWLSPISIALDVEVFEPLDDVVFGMQLRTIDGVRVVTAHSDLMDHQIRAGWNLQPGRYNVEFTLENPLRPGLFKLHIGISLRQHLGRSNLCTLDEAAILEVLDFADNGNTPRACATGLINGKSSWAIRQESTSPLAAAECFR